MCHHGLMPTAVWLSTNTESCWDGSVRRNSPQPPDFAVDAVMQPGPATVRADEPLEKLLSRMAEHHVRVMIVTIPEGRLLGVVRRA